MQSPFKRLTQPLLLKVDFRDSYWNISRAHARCWVGAAMAADLLAQGLVGRPNLLTILASMLTIAVLWAVPARLAGAVAGLYVTQALVSIVAVAAAATSGSALVVSGAAYLWSGWCLLALVQVVLLYLRTPKALMCAS